MITTDKGTHSQILLALLETEFSHTEAKVYEAGADTVQAKASREKTIDVLLKAIEECWSRARQAEDQRATMTNFLISIAAALLAFSAQQGFGISTVPLSLLIIVIGLFGVFMSAKFGQHYYANYIEAVLLKRRLDKLCPQAQLEQIEENSKRLNLKRYPFLARKVPIIYLWQGLYTSVIVLGLVGVLLAIV